MYYNWYHLWDNLIGTRRTRKNGPYQRLTTPYPPIPLSNIRRFFNFRYFEMSKQQNVRVVENGAKEETQAWSYLQLVRNRKVQNTSVRLHDKKTKPNRSELPAFVRVETTTTFIHVVPLMLFPPHTNSFVRSLTNFVSCFFRPKQFVWLLFPHKNAPSVFLFLRTKNACWAWTVRFREVQCSSSGSLELLLLVSLCFNIFLDAGSSRKSCSAQRSHCTVNT